MPMDTFNVVCPQCNGNTNPSCRACKGTGACVVTERAWRTGQFTRICTQEEQDRDAKVNAEAQRNRTMASLHRRHGYCGACEGRGKVPARFIGPLEKDASQYRIYLRFANGPELGDETCEKCNGIGKGATDEEVIYRENYVRGQTQWLISGQWPGREGMPA